MPPTQRIGPPPRRFVVCGDNPLTYRLVNELVIRFGAEVTVILPRRDRNQGPLLGQLPGVTLVESALPDDSALRNAGIADAHALALVNQDDVGNIHAALRAHDLNPDLRMVIRMFNTSLGFRIRTLFTDCAVLSDSAMAAPSFVAAALGEVAPSHVRLPGRTLYVARSADVPDSRVVCGLADTSGGRTRLLPDDHARADLVLALADGAVAGPSDGQRRRGASPALRRIRFLLASGLVRLVVALVTLIVLGLVLMATVVHSGWGGSLYVTLLDAAGDAIPDRSLPPFGKIVQLVITLSGLALIPVATAVVVDGLVRARLADPAPDPSMFGDHVVVVGLGNVGTRVVAQLHDLGVPVICVDADENARGVSLARRLGVPVVFGDATRDDTLRAVSVANARALLLLTSSDVANLEAALQGRAHREDLRVVLRLFDDDLAERVERGLGIAISRSVSRLAAASFAAAMVERQVIGTMSIGRAAIMIIEVPVVAGSALDGQSVGSADEPTEARVIALQHRGVGDLDWRPVAGHQLRASDRLFVVATRAGLGNMLAKTIAPMAQEDVN
ncbi:MAG TPA: NAD-binding protein [Pseudonocardiaceae bacterium]|nr:NAD-binding protein [Pseudonocardiaceae bacterium]